MTNETKTETTPEQLEEEAESKVNFASRIPAHTVRHKDGGTITFKNYSLKLAVLLNCSECEGFENDPRKCVDKLCPLWPFRGYTMKNRSRIDLEKARLMGLKVFEKNKANGVLKGNFVKTATTKPT